jgi:ribosomal protein S17E
MLIVDSEKVKSFGKMIVKHMNGRLEERFQTRKSLVKVVSFTLKGFI